MPKTLLLMVLLATASTSAIAQQNANQTANAEQTVLKLTRDWLDAEAKHDRAALDRIVADDFLGTGPRGNTVSKRDVVPHEGTTAGGLSVDGKDINARVFGDAAIVTGRGTPRSQGQGELRFTVVFIKRHERWEMVAGHLSALPQQEQ
jgi:ketosteroid isomerase-like protein